jgi:cytochrome c-type biogenesis protein CcmH
MRALAVVVAALALAAPAAARGQSQCKPTLGQLEGQVMCPTCKTTLDQSSSPIANRIRGFIRERIAAGDCEGEIKAALVDEFGESVLAAPPKKGFNLLAWVLPLAGLAAGAVAVGVAARRWSSSRAGAPAPAVTPLDPELERRLDDELARFDA